MIAFISSLQGGGNTPQQFFAETFRRQIRAIESNTLRLYIPRLHHLYEKHPKQAYHFKPEMFVQLGGVTEFTFPHQVITLHPGDVCIVPKGMPHGETVRSGVEPFENVVISFYNDTIDIHVAHERSPGKPRAEDVQFYTTDLFPDLVSYLDRIAEFNHSNPKSNMGAIKGLILAEFSLLLGLIEAPDSHRPSASDTVSHCKWLIQHNLQEEDLCLESLAAELGCSPNYLSKLFHRKVGERIVERINRLRIQSAIDALKCTRLRVKAIAAGCGYSDANYFCRVFRQSTGFSPQRFRCTTQKDSSDS